MNLTPFNGPVCLAGPTGTGKTAFALEIAQVLPVEIISVDSALVYRGMDIGTAKPSAAEQDAVPHHLIDLIDPLDAFSAGQFVTAAKRIAVEVLARGRLPLLVGGTMLYFNALHQGLSEMPLADPALRAELDARAAELGWPALHAELARLDPITAARLAPNDSQRIQRALEVCQLAGRPMSELHVQRKGAVDWPMISLEPNDRAWLHRRLAERFELMLKQGLLDEVRALRARGDLHADLPSMRCVGYRQAWAALETNNFKDLAEQGTIATRQLAKRQLTWLRSSPQRHVIACDDPQAKLHLLACLQRLLSAPHAGA
ncbi:tRNA (adenosine(37)-N6)-dimethylallyltransferase MiaA [Paucibacter sp. TC2R-5]|uniref:tRNA (adenosine(37)-N6)-dimethylallyltransferase MiaA n=1 Tax=Paucibacter sp. TC2R-5 TaxID=2893555 RepID=UPI0021E42785|nr:tRNA (adenosine(37)-N6)-dimethylallyltransferase MiaA [Paucibacter sp. TC2R-5]MCV2360936.1 tRNA (adenosine(37)-N6)-dimethylallyltransferase MiaA [Paucibacter sp. TC2R-5]